MSQTKFWILNIVGGACALLIVVSLVLARINEGVGRTLSERQTEINRAQQMQTTAQNLVVRIAQGAQTEPALRELMDRQDLKVNFATDNPAKPTP